MAISAARPILSDCKPFILVNPCPIVDTASSNLSFKGIYISNILCACSITSLLPDISYVVRITLPSSSISGVANEASPPIFLVHSSMAAVISDVVPAIALLPPPK